MLHADAPVPFAHDAEYLQLEYQWLRARSLRLVAEGLVDDLCDQEVSPNPAKRLSNVSYRDAHLSVVERTSDEEHRRKSLDARLRVHRVEFPKKPLGLDVLSRTHGLDATGRMLLLATALPGLGQRFADDVLGGFISFHGALSVDDLCRLLDPKGLHDLLRARTLFLEGSALRRGGLLLVDEPRGEVCPDTLYGLEVRVSLATWGTLFGVPEESRESGVALNDGPF